MVRFIFYLSPLAPYGVLQTMPSALRFATLLLAMTGTALGSGLTARVMAQPVTPQPLLQVEGTLQTDDATLSNGSFYDSHEFMGQANQTVTLLLESEAFDAYLTLVDDQGNRIATNDDINSTTTNAALVTTLPKLGYYRVITYAYQADAQGSYRLTILPTPADQPNPLLSSAEVTLLEANQRIEEGNEQFIRSEYQSALTQWERALILFRKEDVRAKLPQDSYQGEGSSLRSLGNAY